MAAIKSKGNKETELKMVAIFRAAGISGWRRNQKCLGKPDFVFRKSRIAVFVDGCFWHGCKKHCRMPSDNREFWRLKIERNMARDRLVSRSLKLHGWRVLRIWAHSLKASDRVADRVRSALSDAGNGVKMRRVK